MAEGVDHDMNQQQREQANVPHGQEADRTPQVHFSSSATSLLSGLSSQPLASSINLGPNPGHKKKSSFQITSVTETKAHSRGDSNGYDGELDLNESDIVTEDVEVEVETIIEPGTGNGNGGSRFKVVKIPRTENYVRGRWKCHDFPDAESSIATQSSSTSGVTGVSTTAHQSRDNFEKTDVYSNAKPSLTSNFVGNHLANESDVLQPEVGSSFAKLATQANEQSSSSSETFVTVRKKDSNPRLGVVTELTKQGDSSVFESSSLFDSSEGALPEGAHSIVASTSLGGGESEMPIVNKIASAMEQITQIKSDLLSVVNKEVQTLKETISKLTEENQELKLQNEKLRNLVDSRNSAT